MKNDDSYGAKALYAVLWPVLQRRGISLSMILEDGTRYHAVSGYKPLRSLPVAEVESFLETTPDTLDHRVQ